MTVASGQFVAGLWPAAALWRPHVEEIERAHGGQPVIHLAQSTRFRRVPDPEEPLTGHCAITDVLSLGPDLVHVLEITLSAGTPVASSELALLTRGHADPSRRAWRPPRAPAASTPIGTVCRDFTLDGARRYADASGDQNPVHQSNPAAQAAGFPGAVAHGLHVLATALSAAHELGVLRYRDLTEVTARFARPVVLPDTVRFAVARTPDPRRFRLFAGTNSGEILKAASFGVADGRGLSHDRAIKR
ncbi:MaoC/PaaZ C-terminal domain-containing protein [Amycolatopsis pigmentata]|uniref:MaoC/PaaZ C-terminal domain-containing protein n=1 Tax=Amycolatopsis pigmentata TaxID=450801 RepID=A0ABW5FRS0_9PSEU